MTSLRAGALVTAAMSTRCYGDDRGLRLNVTSSSSTGIDGTGNEKMASTESRPTLAVVPVVSPTRRQSGGDVRDHLTVNTNQIHSRVLSCAHGAFDSQVSKNVSTFRHRRRRQHSDDETSRVKPTALPPSRISHTVYHQKLGFSGVGRVRIRVRFSFGGAEM